MKKRAGIIITACVLGSFAVGAALLMVMGGGKKPYKDLDASQIRAAAVRLHRLQDQI